jgi:hypothetical protein
LKYAGSPTSCATSGSLGIYLYFLWRDLWCNTRRVLKFDLHQESSPSTRRDPRQWPVSPQALFVFACSSFLSQS